MFFLLFDEDILENHGKWEGTNVRHIKENLTLEHLISLFHYHDILIYPSEGEGFGLIPLQALATGMPVILPHLDSMVDLMKNAAENFELQSDIFYNQIPEIVKDYSWQHRTNMAMDSLIDRIGIDMFENSGYPK